MSLGYSLDPQLSTTAHSHSPASSTSSDDDHSLHSISLNDSRTAEDQARPITRAQSKQGAVEALVYTPYLLHSGASRIHESCGTTSTSSDSESPILSSAWTSAGSISSPAPLEGPNTIEEMKLEKDDAMMPFIRRLRSMLGDEESYCDVLRWDESGTSFIVRPKSERLLGEVFPEAFGHSKYPSFTRQLNIYGFTRLSDSALAELLDPNLSAKELKAFHGWTCPSFYRGSPLPSASAFNPASSTPFSAQEDSDPTLPWDSDTRRMSEGEKEAQKAAATMRPRESKKRLEKKRLKASGMIEGGLSPVDEEDEDDELSWMAAGPSKRRRS
ncbi:hypothetical protein BCR35DRAFT_331638 [Leucosporidium creatinivorum]|uniref:HSF-type DNA-binding domain-containing protein n=1 Tax=Leucosporidium creatinivorum TaxID=106004 RepID=A0A1Y2FBD9_9BASI|nr:hypothetical protein BCR35DRAFT_331638 [Leucosporidium creatinivorum]